MVKAKKEGNLRRERIKRRKGKGGRGGSGEEREEKKERDVRGREKKTRGRKTSDRDRVGISPLFFQTLHDGTNECITAR
jgi:hypothetical protein